MGTFGVAAVMVLVLSLGAGWRGWKNYRNSLPDEVRAELFWNDRNYERLQYWITMSLWILVGILTVATAGVFLLFHFSGKF